MREELIELQNERQKVDAREFRALLEFAEQVLESMRALCDAGNTERGCVAFDRVQLAREPIKLHAEFAVRARGLLQDGVDELQSRLSRVDEGGELYRVDLHHAEQHDHLRIGAVLRFAKLARQQHMRGHIAHPDEYLPRTVLIRKSMEIEL